MKLTKLINALGTLGLMALTIFASQTAVAYEDSDQHSTDYTFWYGGLNVGQSRAAIDDVRIKKNLLDNRFITSSFEESISDTGYKLFGGYQFNQYFALEGGYFNLGEFDYTAHTQPLGSLSGDIKLNGLNIDAVATMPFTDHFSGFARAGVNNAKTKVLLSGTGAITPTSSRIRDTDANLKLGLGVQYDFTDAFAMRAEAERYKIDDAVNNAGEIDLISLGVIYRFGRDKHEPAPKPRPVVVAPVVTEQYCSILDIQYEINANEIQLEEEEKLAVVGRYMQKYPKTTAVIEGHADNIGNAEDNQKLSEERARSVTNYLTKTFQIAPSRLTVKGYGDTRPLVSNVSEQGKTSNRRIAAVISCVTDIEGLTVVPARVTIALVVEFDPYKDVVKEEYRNELRKVAEFMKKNPTLKAVVEGHADKLAGNVSVTPELSMAVSKRRAANVVDYLVKNFDVERSRLSAEGFGQTRLIDYGSTLAGQQTNRRVNIIFDYPAKK